MRKSIIAFIEMALVSVVLFIFLGNNNSNASRVDETSFIVDKTFLKSSIDDTFYIEGKEYKYSDDAFEEEIINSNNKSYKIIETSIDGYKVHLLVVYDASKLKLIGNKGFNTPDNIGLQRVSEMAQDANASVAVNAGGFYDVFNIQKDIPDGYVIKDGNILYGDRNRIGRLIGITYDNKLWLVKSTAFDAINNGMRDAVEFGPFLIVDGNITNEARSMREIRASRVIIGDRSDGLIIIAVTDGGAIVGPKMGNIVEFLRQIGITNAANLDGGASTQLFENGKLISTTRWIGGAIIPQGRRVLNAFAIIDN